MAVVSHPECSPARLFLAAFAKVVASACVLVVFVSPVCAEGSVTAMSSSEAAGAVAAAGPLRIVYFHSPTCHDCLAVKRRLPAVTRAWGSRVRFELRDIMAAANLNDLLLYEKHYGATVSAPPAIFIGEQCLIGRKEIIARLDDVIAGEIAKEAATFSPAVAAEGASERQRDSEIIAHFRDFHIGAIVVAGLLDGVNPCAFTTIVFFLSTLAYLKRGKRDLIAIGLAFTAGVFAAYFFLGVGLLGVAKSFSVNSGLSMGLTYAVGGLAFVLAGWSLLDFIRYKKTGDTSKITLGLPKSVRERIHKIIRTGLRTRNLIIGAIAVGFMVAVLESLCTGQVYLPTIVFVTRTPGLRAGAIGYLLLYNVMFIVPLVVVLFMTYMGVTSRRLGNMVCGHLGLSKLAMCALFIFLGILVFATAVPSEGANDRGDPVDGSMSSPMPERGDSNNFRGPGD